MEFTKGVRVAFSRDFLRCTMQFSGPDKPCHSGPFARGIIEELMEFSSHLRSNLAVVRWDDGVIGRVLVGNLVREDCIHLESV